MTFKWRLLQPLHIWEQAPLGCLYLGTLSRSAAEQAFPRDQHTEVNICPKWCCSTFHSIPCWNRTLFSPFLKVLFWETEPNALSPSVSNLSLYLSLSVCLWEGEAAIPCPTVLFWGLVYKVLLQSLRKGTTAAMQSAAMSEQRRAPRGPSWDSHVQIQRGWELTRAHTAAAPSQQLSFPP